jgi:hypothetical protein
MDTTTKQTHPTPSHVTFNFSFVTVLPNPALDFFALLPLLPGNE